jgi:hypothetical protein
VGGGGGGCVLPRFPMGLGQIIISPSLTLPKHSTSVWFGPPRSPIMDQTQLSVASDVEPGGMPTPATGTGVPWSRGLHPRDIDRLNQAHEDHAAIVEEIPVEKAGLGAFSVACLLFNRLIGSGIFNSGSVIFYNTQSIGASLLIWLYGVVMALSGVLLYIELGLTVPRWQLRDGTKISTPRSGAELVYVNITEISSSSSTDTDHSHSSTIFSRFPNTWQRVCLASPS